jgi:hypothetical protein
LPRKSNQLEYGSAVPSLSNIFGAPSLDRSRCLAPRAWRPHHASADAHGHGHLSLAARRNVLRMAWNLE